MPNSNKRRAVVVTAHTDPESATVSTARAVADGLRRGFDEVRMHDVTESNFDPTFGPADLAAYRDARPLPDDVRAEQRLLETFDAVAIVFPVYWWGLPGTLKGWVDRVFTQGWAYDDIGVGADLRAPRRLYFFAIGAVGRSTYAKHGYLDSMRTQLIEGLADYSGAEDSDLILLSDGQSDEPERHRARADVAREAAAAIAARR